MQVVNSLCEHTFIDFVHPHTYTDGRNGTDGIPGVVGDRGPQGPTGQPGEEGLPGLEGRRGPQGPQGVRGAPGINGRNGTDAVDGLQGDMVLNHFHCQHLFQAARLSIVVVHTCTTAALMHQKKTI